VPTFFRFAGIELPWEVHGNDLTPLLEDPSSEWPFPMLLTATGQKYGSDTDILPEGDEAFHANVPWYVMLRQGPYKYVRPLVPDLEELYDLSEDPEELNNLANDPEYKEVLERFRETAIAELRKDGAGFVDRMPAVPEAY
jgi:arylsulfatase A-like enzyme